SAAHTKIIATKRPETINRHLSESTHTRTHTHPTTHSEHTQTHTHTHTHTLHLHSVPLIGCSTCCGTRSQPTTSPHTTCLSLHPLSLLTPPGSPHTTCLPLHHLS